MTSSRRTLDQSISISGKKKTYWGDARTASDTVREGIKDGLPNMVAIEKILCAIIGAMTRQKMTPTIKSHDTLTGISLGGLTQIVA